MMDNTDIVKTVLDECKSLEDILNGNLLPSFVQLHNADPKYNQLALKQEVLASSSAFFIKKKYGLYIINKEGKTVSEFDIKGMIMRRSNFPSYSKEKVQILMDMILKEDVLDIENIKTFIKQTELEVLDLCNNHSKEIAGAVSFNKPLEEYIGRLPSHVMAMNLWNELEYKYFVPGTKGYLFRINGINELEAPDHIIKNKHLLSSKNKQIVIPMEEKCLPSYYILNTSEQLQFVWTDRVKEVLGVLMESQNNISNDIFE